MRNAWNSLFINMDRSSAHSWKAKLMQCNCSMPLCKLVSYCSWLHRRAQFSQRSDLPPRSRYRFHTHTCRLIQQHLHVLHAGSAFEVGFQCLTVSRLQGEVARTRACVCVHARTHTHTLHGFLSTNAKRWFSHISGNNSHRETQCGWESSTAQTERTHTTLRFHELDRGSLCRRNQGAAG